MYNTSQKSLTNNFVLGGIYNVTAQNTGNDEEFDQKPSEPINFESQMQTNNDTLETEGKNDHKNRFKNLFLSRKKSSVRAKERKIRQNRHLRKTILPKNALMALNEVKGITIGDFVINSCENGYVAIITVNKKQYQGYGISKAVAKNGACEKALRDYILEKMIQKPRKNKVPIKSDMMEISENTDADSQDSSKVDEDDVPMINLASFALYKLFCEWEKEGYIVPELHPEPHPDSKVVVKEPKALPIRTELPEGWKDMHPAALLCVMRPGLTYNDIGAAGVKNNTIQNISVVVDGKKYYGSGRSKKIARRNTAAIVCNTLFGTNFDIIEHDTQKVIQPTITE